MRRSDYLLISAALKAAKPVGDGDRADDWRTGWQETVITVGEHLQADNPAFDQELFVLNCGVEL
jgi:hypothetical protein